MRCREDFLSAPGIEGAADFIESAPHPGSGIDPLKELRKETGSVMTGCYGAAALMVLLLRYGFRIRHAWIFGLLAAIAGIPVNNAVLERLYRKQEARAK